MDAQSVSDVLTRELAAEVGTELLQRIGTMATVLRRRGVVVSSGQLLDAVRATAAVDLGQRPQLRCALQATMVKRVEHLRVFDAVFDAAFPLRPPAEQRSCPVPGSADLPADIADALAEGDTAALEGLAMMAVDTFGGFGSNDLSSERYHLRRTLNKLDLTQLLDRAIAAAARYGDDGPPLSELHERLAALERLIGQEVRQRLASAGGEPPTTFAGELDDIGFLEASPVDLDRLREAVSPLARRLAARLARRRRQRRSGRIDIRRTVRCSLATGGVPFDVRFHREKPVRPEVVVLADVSGSVAEFARFFLLLLHALHDELPNVRSFCFVDGVDEVTHLLESLPVGLQVHHLLTATEVVADSGHSDYGAVFERLRTRYDTVFTGRTTVLVAGDARTNGREPRVDALEAIHRQVRRLYWLNPEPRSLWDRRDSVMGRYATACDEVVEVRNVHQLSDFVVSLA